MDLCTKFGIYLLVFPFLPNECSGLAECGGLEIVCDLTSVHPWMSKKVMFTDDPNRLIQWNTNDPFINYPKKCFPQQIYKSAWFINYKLNTQKLKSQNMFANNETSKISSFGNLIKR